MEKTTQTSNFIVERLKIGIPQLEIRQNLMAVGWTGENADIAISEGLTQLGAPAPKLGRSLARKPSSTLDVVANFFSFVLLGITATALGILYFQIINKWFPDTLAERNGMGSFSVAGIQYAIAALLVAFPSYVLVVKIWFKRFREDEDREESKLTKWLTYLVLLITSITIIADLITTVFYFLQGEVSARFFLKAFTIFTVALLVLGFYVLERRKVQYGQDISRRVFQSFGWVVGVIVVTGIILGFIASGSPKTERMRALDRERSQNLSQIANCINNFTFDRKRLPESLGELQSSTNYQYCAAQVNDPETQIAYEYIVSRTSSSTGPRIESQYELCATFSLASRAADAGVSFPFGGEGKWTEHDAGRSCDTETAVIERFEPIMKEIDRVR